MKYDTIVYYCVNDNAIIIIIIVIIIIAMPTYCGLRASYNCRVLIGCPAALWLAVALLCCNESDPHRKEWLARVLPSAVAKQQDDSIQSGRSCFGAESSRGVR